MCVSLIEATTHGTTEQRAGKGWEHKVGIKVVKHLRRLKTGVRKLVQLARATRIHVTEHCRDDYSRVYSQFQLLVKWLQTSSFSKDFPHEERRRQLKWHQQCGAPQVNFSHSQKSLPYLLLLYICPYLPSRSEPWWFICAD